MVSVEFVSVIFHAFSSPIVVEVEGVAEVSKLAKLYLSIEYLALKI